MPLTTLTGIPSNEWRGSMRPDLAVCGYYLVTDSGLSRHGSRYDVEAAIGAGCRIVQYREKAKSTREMVAEARELANICRGRAIFLVNDRIDVALAANADGVHIGQDDMPYAEARRLLGHDRIIGLTTHSVEESLDAERLGADYIGLSPIFATTTKADAGAGCGLDMVRRVRMATGLPIVAIGGISLHNAGSVIEAGADSVAAISAVVCAEDPAAQAGLFVEVADRAKHRRAGM